MTFSFLIMFLLRNLAVMRRKAYEYQLCTRCHEWDTVLGVIRRWLRVSLEMFYWLWMNREEKKWRQVFRLYRGVGIPKVFPDQREKSESLTESK